MNKYFKILNKFKGFGEPYNSYWFIGIEEGATWRDKPESDNKNYKRYAQGHFYCDESDEFNSPVYQIISKTMIGINDKKFDNFNGWQNYKDYKLFRKGNNVFQSNLYPLGKPNTKTWPPHYKNIFDLGKDDIEKYRTHVKTNRFLLLYSFWKDSKPKITICFGISFWNDFKNLFKINDIAPDIKGEGYFLIFRASKIILTPFFNNRFMSDERIGLLVKHILTYVI